MHKKIIIFVLLIFTKVALQAQVVADSTNFSIYYDSPKEYVVAGIEISGIKYLDKDVLRQLSGLNVGDEVTIPGDEITRAIKKYWRQGLFSDVKISAYKIVGTKIWLDVNLTERPRLSRVTYHGVSKSEREDITGKVLLLKGGQVTDNLINTAERQILKLLHSKGFFNTEVNIVQRDDTIKENHVVLDIFVDKKEKVKVKDVEFIGNVELTTRQLEKAMKKTKAKKLRHFFRSKKFLDDKYKEDKLNLVKRYNQDGYRDAVILADSVIHNKAENTVKIKIWIEEGRKYYFRDIKWVGNTAYDSYYLTRVLGIKKGDVFDQKLLNERLNEDDDAVSNIYLNSGYLFFNLNPVEINIVNDSIDLEMRIREGAQATISKIIITGNTKTHENVARREIRTVPGQLFSKEAIIRSVRELAQLGHFNPETMNPVPIPNPEQGTVDIRYELEERANDQIELSGGWGGNIFVGTLGLRFSNFSVRNLFRKGSWGNYLPTGDGQTLSLRAQTNGSYYQSYSFSFVEPWLGGKKRNSFTLSSYYSRQTGGRSDYRRAYQYNYPGYGGRTGNNYSPSYEITRSMSVIGTSIGLGYRLKWPDDFFTNYHELSYQRFILNNYSYFRDFSNGISNSFSIKTVFGRNSIDNPLFTRRGSNITLSLQLTPPYSLLSGRDYNNTDLSPQDRYRYVEFHKWLFKGDNYSPISSNEKLILRSQFEFGFLGYYNKNLRSPFEQFEVGGDGMSGYTLYGRDLIRLRGYSHNSLRPVGFDAANIYQKFTFELRYPVTLSESAVIYGLAFFDAGNGWYDFSEYDPFDIKRAAGAGVRIFLPMFGLMGFDWGYGFDFDNAGGGKKGEFHFMMGQQF